MTKSDLRSLYLGKRKSLTPQQIAEASRRVADNFFGSFDLNCFHYLHCFVSIKRLNELDTSPVFDRIWMKFPEITTVAPRVNIGTGEMDSLVYSADTEVAEGRWKISEPKGGETISPEKMDIVLVPLVCFDRHGHRVGYGKGYYDRFLSKCRPDCLKVGLSFFGPVDEISDAHGGDVRLDFCVTPDCLYAIEESNAN